MTVIMQTADEFLATGTKFQLGFLETEKPHPETRDLSRWAVEDLPRAISVLAGIDVLALEKMRAHLKSFQLLKTDIEKTWAAGNKVFLCGCGATGRLSLALEYLHRERFAGKPEAESVVAFMAGGDVALVHSLEGFEDFPEYGARHLRELGFKAGDLLISCTEGGETPYVIGATEEAAIINHAPDAHSSPRGPRPYFLYCNPDEVLRANVERSQRIIDNPAIVKINLTVGPMALAGSTRMQASTVLQLAVGVALLSAQSLALSRSENFEKAVGDMITELQTYLRDEAVAFLPGFIERESSEYRDGRFVLYGVETYPITVFTDTTERAPTFSLTPFSHREADRLLKLKPSLSYVFFPETKFAGEAWKKMLLRSPRPLNWSEIDTRTEMRYLQAFDFSEKAREFRAWLTSGAEHSDFVIRHDDGSLMWDFQDLQKGLITPSEGSPELHSLSAHLLLKMFLNIHSTLIMGRLGRYRRNLMTWVYPTNGKLIDRATRYIRTLLSEDGTQVSYEETVRALFDVKTRITGNDSIVLATYDALKGR